MAGLCEGGNEPPGSLKTTHGPMCTCPLPPPSPFSAAFIMLSVSMKRNRQHGFHRPLEIDETFVSGRKYGQDRVLTQNEWVLNEDQEDQEVTAANSWIANKKGLSTSEWISSLKMTANLAAVRSVPGRSLDGAGMAARRLKL
ncbi:hypothetical protein ANN_25828 [Periplaneta americana]|uniref:Uncharacterized protein n=1 Tax=Periplaneta americana TaxID=6978 RepID=A0ABQ8S509_PERAM|nr:hypothetical protein ANN_25828 [Periplaneta americana]